MPTAESAVCSTETLEAATTARFDVHGPFFRRPLARSWSTTRRAATTCRCCCAVLDRELPRELRSRRGLDARLDDRVILEARPGLRRAACASVPACGRSICACDQARNDIARGDAPSDEQIELLERPSADRRGAVVRLGAVLRRTGLRPRSGHGRAAGTAGSAQRRVRAALRLPLLRLRRRPFARGDRRLSWRATWTRTATRELDRAPDRRLCHRPQPCREADAPEEGPDEGRDLLRQGRRRHLPHLRRAARRAHADPGVELRRPVEHRCWPPTSRSRCWAPRSWPRTPRATTAWSSPPTR